MSDYRNQYDDLVQKCKQANADKRKILKSIEQNLKKLQIIVCQPDPPGCNPGPTPDISVEDLANACRESNTQKKELVATIYGEVEALLKNVCEPDPPGCQ